ncbi:unnamed protein product [Rhodiola kirilowii]
MAGERREDENGNAEEAEEAEEALVALIGHRTKEVQHLRERRSYYESMLEKAEKRLSDSECKLCRLRGAGSAEPSKPSMAKDKNRSFPDHNGEGFNKSDTQFRPTVSTNVRPKASQSALEADSRKVSVAGHDRDELTVHASAISVRKIQKEKLRGESEVKGTADRGTKRKFEKRDHQELIPSIRSCSSPHFIKCHANTLIASQHKRKLRSLALCPVNNQLFATSALDGVINLWEIHARGSSASVLSSTDCASLKEKRWAEDIAWHPEGNSLFSAYSADGGDSQVSILNLNARKERARVTFIDEKPHFKGIINSIAFMPWDPVCFATAGSDHAAILWKEQDEENSWKPKALHRNLHSSAVMGIAGMQQKQIIVSVGADKRIIGFDPQAGRADFKHQLESKCIGVLPNPCDFNLFMVQTGAHAKQLRLFDIRLRQTELHSFGWEQSSSDSQSALINQAWSPDGLYITSGSADPLIHIFDIRFNSPKPSQSIKAHHKRVFKAVWHGSVPLLVSISSDLNIGLHKI